MKTIKLIILGIVVLYFQIIFGASFTIYNIIPNFLIAFLVYTGINSGIRTTLTIAFFWGLAYDLLQPFYLGMNSFAFIIIAMIIGNFHETINKRRFVMVSLSILIINFLYYSIFLIYSTISIRVMENFLFTFLFSIFYNSIITILSIYIFLISNKLKLVINV